MLIVGIFANVRCSLPTFSPHPTPHTPHPAPLVLGPEKGSISLTR
ncbi:hypothetical protein VL20_195 [Microcystis panniformis FACHB-1757]|uniref:Uncharacterized protein n=1 Tax=Microcystis panniformis FACHB-1757 TaxID=1638788 RepID=A0A0K1RUE3_9CHRO|nr:hypothetical protein VL20_195 [Microcystis panniformis FACHB-1757]